MVAYSRFSLGVGVGVASLLAIAACARINNPSMSGTGGTSGTGNGGVAIGSGSGGSAAGSTGTGSGGSSSGGDIGTGPACQDFTVVFEPKIPTVYLMVDHSGSMFNCLGSTDTTSPCADHANTGWEKFKAAVLPVVQSLQGQVRFGFASFYGTDASHGNMCPILDKVAPALNNYQSISDVYTGLAFRTSSDKWETPTSETFDVLGAELIADTTPGDKVILFVTDGQPDYCDDSNALCAPDSVVAHIQQWKAAGVSTIVFGLLSNLNNLPPGTLKAFANAGAGEPTLAPVNPGGTVFDFFDQCNGVAGWHADLVAYGKQPVRGTTLGAYAPTAGPSQPYSPNVADQAALTNQIAAALSGVKSCTFDLSGHIKVDTTQLDKATIKIEGNVVPLSDSNGWHMLNDTTLELVGSACTTWRDPNVHNIDFGFPCQIIIPT